MIVDSDYPQRTHIANLFSNDPRGDHVGHRGWVPGSSIESAAPPDESAAVETAAKKRCDKIGGRLAGLGLSEVWLGFAALVAE